MKKIKRWLKLCYKVLKHAKLQCKLEEAFKFVDFNLNNEWEVFDMQLSILPTDYNLLLKWIKYMKLLSRQLFAILAKSLLFAILA